MDNANNKDVDLGYEPSYYIRGIVKAAVLFVLVGSMIWIKEMGYNPYWIALPLALTCLYLAYLYRDLREKLFDKIDIHTDFTTGIIAAQNNELKKENAELREILIESKVSLNKIEGSIYIEQQLADGEDMPVPEITTIQDIDPMRQIAERAWSTAKKSTS